MRVRWTMRGFLALLIFALILSISAVSLLAASSDRGMDNPNVIITCSPEVISSTEGTTTITVTSSKKGIGFIRVIGPDGNSSMVGIRILHDGGSVSKKYPDDFRGDITLQNGEYTVEVFFAGRMWNTNFYVTFFVIPEFPLGTLMAVAASLIALIGLTTIRRFQRKRGFRRQS